jgi:hypothetical protein
MVVSAIDAFDITDLSRSETAREGRETRCPVRPMSAWLWRRGLEGKPPPCRSSVEAFRLQSLKKHPALSCVEVIFNAFLHSASAPADLARRLETRCSVLGSLYLGT